MVLIQAYNESKFIGCSLHFKSDKAFYGRYWGTLYEIPYLHFELCYYQAIEFAIKNKLYKVEVSKVPKVNIKSPEVIFQN